MRAKNTKLWPRLPAAPQHDYDSSVLKEERQQVVPESEERGFDLFVIPGNERQEPAADSIDEGRVVQPEEDASHDQGADQHGAECKHQGLHGRSPFLLCVVWLVVRTAQQYRIRFCAA